MALPKSRSTLGCSLLGVCQGCPGVPGSLVSETWRTIKLEIDQWWIITWRTFDTAEQEGSFLRRQDILQVEKLDLIETDNYSNVIGLLILHTLVAAVAVSPCYAPVIITTKIKFLALSENQQLKFSIN